ncbi:hypothetical protein [Archangium violaceum]|uniref:hypothetical protein n=1 Tax=Archangium violaceum TaxID=83451 RepID=UPI0036DDDECD
MPPPWEPRSDIEKKEKTGDLEQIRILRAAHLSVSESAKNLLTSHQAIKDTSSRIAASLKKLEEIDIELVDIGKIQSTAQKLQGMQDLQKMLEDISKKLGVGHNQFVVNLALFDFRTTGGGRARKSTTLLKTGADTHYARPFSGSLPAPVSLLLKAIKQPRTPSQSTAQVVITPRKDLKYLPPTRFTASFPLLLSGDKNAHKTLRAPRMPGSTSSPASPLSHVKFADLGSFGFAEPGYCTWEKNESSETAGTRLSLGAYVLDTDYLDALLSLMKSLSQTDKQNYLKYGGVGVEHVKVLRDLFMGSNGPTLAFNWLFQLVDAALALCQEADRHNPLLRAFFLHIREKIDARTMKLQELRRKGISKNDTAFDYLWVFESTLWEFLFLGATCLSMRKIVDTLKTQQRLKPFLDTWEPSVGLSEGLLVEPVKIGNSTFDRFYFPSGTAAADQLYEALWAKAIGPFAMGTNLKQLSTFTPYFEFYQGNGMLNPKELAEKVKTNKDRPKNCTATQIWLNLSDDLHSGFLNKPDATTVGDQIAKKVLAHLQTLLKSKPASIKDFTVDYSKVYLVIDYTKFASDIPNGYLYPILAQLRDTLKQAGTAQGIKEVIFLRSNLKYNTGSLDRYQSGELLMHNNQDTREFATSLAERSRDSFKNDNDGWTLMNEYIPMMKKVYLLSDAIGFARWGAYTQLWQGYSGARPNAARELSILTNMVLGFITHPLEPIFTNLVRDVKSKSFKALLPAGTRQKISTFWTRLGNDRAALKRLGESVKGVGDVERKLQEVIGYLNTGLQDIIDALLQTKKSLPVSLHKQTKQVFLAYLSRLQAAKKNLEESGIQLPPDMAMHTQDEPLAEDRPKMSEPAFFTLKNKIVRLAMYPLESLFTNLVQNVKSNSFKTLLPAGTRQKISTYWTRLDRDRTALKNLGENMKEVGEVGRKVQEVIGYLEPGLQEIIDEMVQARKDLPVSLHKQTKQVFLAYLSRLQAAKKNLEEAELQLPQDTTLKKAG